MILLIKLLLAIPFLLYASYTDLRTWRVSNNVWVAMLAVLLPLTALQYYMSPVGLTIPLLVLVVWLGALNLLYRFGWGGADVKALIVIAICFPWSMLIMWLIPALIIISSPVAFIGYIRNTTKTPYITTIFVSYLVAFYYWSCNTYPRAIELYGLFGIIATPKHLFVSWIIVIAFVIFFIILITGYRGKEDG